MNISRTLRRILPLTALFAFACGSDDTTAPEAPALTGITLSAQEIVLDAGKVERLRIAVTPADADVQPADLQLVDAETGQPSRFVSTECTAREEKGTFEMAIRDNRLGSKYKKTLQVRCAATGIVSEPLIVMSTPYMPIVRVHTDTPQNAITKDTWVPGTISIDGGNAFDDLPEMVTEVKGRGNSTWGWNKKPYALKLDKKQEVLGMPKHKRWCLIANYMDRTHMRNRVAYYIGQHSKLAYTVRNRYAELYFNDQYYGFYLLTEQIKVDKNRVDIPELEAADNAGDALTGGYLLEFDNNYDEVRKFRTTGTDIPVNIKSPDAEEMTDEQFAYIRKYVNDADAAVAALRKGGSTAEPFKYIDRESMIDFWICFEVMANHEILHPKSIYFHKDRGVKLVAGPIWDFDYQTLIEGTKTQWIDYDLAYQYNEFPWYENNWWNILLMYDASFRADVKKRWQEWYPFLKTVPDFMEQERKAIATAVAHDNQRWTISGTGNPNGDEWLSFEMAVARLKSVYSTRLEWMNSQIAKW